MDDLFTGKDAVVLEFYQQLLKELKSIGDVGVEIKKTSIHLMNASAFAGVHPKKSFINLNIKTDKTLSGKRVSKSEQISKNRWHNNVRLESLSDIDAELVAWLKKAYELSA